MQELLGNYEENVKGVLHVMCNTPVSSLGSRAE